ncbi:MAG: DUF1704 domain-containing protein [Alphaproteobacteria bacterium]|nr:DUF1704 domain-containing protein [Alphaproteobacteria bacterium]
MSDTSADAPGQAAHGDDALSDLDLADIPDAVRRADAVHHDILRTTAFSQHLNPINTAEARRVFGAGRAAAPPFRYKPLTQADELLRRLDAAEPPRDHPAGALVGQCFDGTRLMIRALRDRTGDAFDELARSADWYPDAALLGLRFADEEPPDEPFDLRATALIDALERALLERGMGDWVVEPDRVMSARVLVDGAKRLLRVNPDSRFRRRDLTRLVVHEIDVHAWRTRCGQGQALRCFETGLPGSLTTEEGLAMQAEQRAGLASPGVLARQVEVVHAIDLARRAGFREVYQDLEARVGGGLAWGICTRIKRGLAWPDRPGVYAKDSVYLRGWKVVGDWLAAGGDIGWLYVGKVSTTDPVGRWLDQGWVRPGRVPSVWRNPPVDAATT